MRFLTREQVRALDRIAIDELGIPGPTLMERAGKGAAAVCTGLLPRRRGRSKAARVVVVAGTGNNGGDAFVVARYLARGGARVRVLLLGEPRTDDARTMLKKIRRHRGVRLEDASRGAWERAARALDEAELVVDGVFGTGLDREVVGPARAVLDRLSGVAAPVVALDIPSGLDANTGHPLGVAVRARATPTFSAPKRGLVVTPGIAYAGEVTVVSLGTPPELLDRTGWEGELVEAADVRGLVPSRPVDGQKGTFGHVLVVAGSPGKTGAALLAGVAALRMGAGLATIAARGTAAAALDAKVIEVMTETLPWEGIAGARRVMELAAQRDAVVLGPGLGTDEEAGRLVQEIVLEVSRPLVVDADATTLLSKDPSRLRRRRAPTILTPHPGELARLLAVSVAEIQEDRIAAARRAATATDAVVILKGARTVIAEPGGAVFVNSTGGPLLATGGTGDVLAGAVGSLLAQGLAIVDAARLATYLHGLAADVLTEDGTDRGVLAGEICACLPAAIRRLRLG